MKTTRLVSARTNNLKGVDLEIEPGTLLAVVGPSGAGKSSLAFSTLYAEGQRRYIESFSAYARQFLERLNRPPVEELDPVAAGIAVDRQAPVRTSRSTVGTMTEITDYAKEIWARASDLYCSGCGARVERDNAEGAASRVLAELSGEKITVSFPVPLVDTEHYLGVRESLIEDGYRRALIDGEVLDLADLPPSAVVEEPSGGKAKKKSSKKKKTKKSAKKTSEPVRLVYRGQVDMVADRIAVRPSDRSRLVEALEMALKRGGGKVSVHAQSGATLTFSTGLSCPTCDLDYRDPTPAMFSFNNPVGACEACRGFGRTMGVDLERVIPDRSLSLSEGAIKAWSGKKAAWERRKLKEHCEAEGVPMDVPVSELSEAQWQWLLEGEGKGFRRHWFGIMPWFKWLESRVYKMHVRVFLSRFRKYETCSTCDGTRLKSAALGFRVGAWTLPEFLDAEVVDSLAFVRKQAKRFDGDPAISVLFTECERRLSALSEVGLSYLTLSRASRTLSGGEAQRVSLTSALGASLNGAMFVLDEPSVGLHPSDVERLFGVIQRLCDGDNLAIVVEHDRHIIEGADRVLELGPGAGALGGKVVFDGTPAELTGADTVTGRALRSDGPAPRERKDAEFGETISLLGACGNNLRGDPFSFPTRALVGVTGVSGSGKSSLVVDTLVPAVARHLGVASDEAPLPFASLSLPDTISSVTLVDQAPLGRTSRGNPATYLKVWDVVRKRFAAEKEAKTRGYKPGMFSFNVAGGRCETCKGEGAETVEMQFLADVTFSCPDCQGRRFRGPVLDIKYRDLSIAEVLELTVEDAAKHFVDDEELVRKLEPLTKVGLSYLGLGQPLNTLSGGEAQRLKLAQALSSSKGERSQALIVLDEPTAGLHRNEVDRLIDLLTEMVDDGASVVVIEHDMHVVAACDVVVDIGPEAGARGGQITASGTPSEVASATIGATPRYLRDAIERNLGPGKQTASKKEGNRPAKSETVIERAIEIEGAREHNLKNVKIAIPRDELTVVTGPSGSGKSSLAFDVLYAEGQRRFLETLTPYARQYMPQLPRPVVDIVRGVPPSVALEQRITRGGRNSTVATVTEVAHYLRLVWAKAGVQYCPDCEVPIEASSEEGLLRQIEKLAKRSEVTLSGPVVRGRKGSHRELLARLRKDGYEEAVIDGELQTLAPKMSLSRYDEHDVEVVVGRATGNAPELGKLLRAALRHGEGMARAYFDGKRGHEAVWLSTERTCPSCWRAFVELDPRYFSFNTRQGGCEVCEGAGIVEDESKRGRDREESRRVCDACAGTRLSGQARAVRLSDFSIDRFFAQSVTEAKRALRGFKLTGKAKRVAEAPLLEVERRLGFLEEIGLGYLTLDRSARTLSGGELQRVRLSAQLGSGLTGALYVLDEPTIGLHPRDTGKLITALRSLVDKGNSVIVVEHDSDTILAADRVIDMGPSGGHGGGEVVAIAPPHGLPKDRGTGAALERSLPVPSRRRRVTKSMDAVTLRGARQHNLAGVDLRVPIGRMTAVTGVSGSGKSTLIREVFLPALRDHLGLVASPPGTFDTLSIQQSEDIERPLCRAVEIDQSPIGRTPRSVPATYLGVWDLMRKLLAGTPEARARGYSASRFSFNTAAGRCPVCDGQGVRRIEMSFLSDVDVPCEGCHGMRFSPETLEVRLHGLSAGELLELEISEAIDVFSQVAKIVEPLRLMDALGLGYLKLGQPSNTLSGGEAQRLKLVAELQTGKGGESLYVMDEPTTGLHRDDVARLLSVMHQLVDRGDTVLVIEHHPDIIAASDWVVDLGPEGGTGGGKIVVEGTPEKIAKKKGSHTGHAIRELVSA